MNELKICETHGVVELPVYATPSSTIPSETVCVLCLRASISKAESGWEARFAETVVESKKKLEALDVRVWADSEGYKALHAEVEKSRMRIRHLEDWRKRSEAAHRKPPSWQLRQGIARELRGLGKELGSLLERLAQQVANDIPF